MWSVGSGCVLYYQAWQLAIYRLQQLVSAVVTLTTPLLVSCLKVINCRKWPAGASTYF